MIAKIKQYAVWILAAAVIILGFSQWRSCNDKTAENLTAEKKVILQQRDSISESHAQVVASDSILKINYRKDTIRFKQLLDSSIKENKLGQVRFIQIKTQLNQTISDLSDIINNGADTALISELNQLKTQLASANGIVNDLQQNSGFRDSVMISEIGYRDSVIQAKDRTIENLKSNYAGMQVLLDKANADLDTAIEQLKKGKRINVLRTVGEALLVIGLILK